MLIFNTIIIISIFCMCHRFQNHHRLTKVIIFIIKIIFIMIITGDWLPNLLRISSSSARPQCLSYQGASTWWLHNHHYDNRYHRHCHHNCGYHDERVSPCKCLSYQGASTWCIDCSCHKLSSSSSSLP